MKTVFSAGGLRPRARAARATPGPGWAGGLQPLARAEITSPAPGGRGDSGRAPERRARSWPPDTFFESSYPEMQRKHIPRVNEYQS